jgi:hypothetical protein
MSSALAGISTESRPPHIGVVYLARCAEGVDTFARFIRSYRNCPAGRDHDLIILYKGFSQRTDLAKARALFAEVPHIGIELDDVGYDIGSYIEASRRVEHKYLVFLNSFTELKSPAWLAKLSAHAERDVVGIAGAMGSCESLFDSVGLLGHVITSCNRLKMPYDSNIHKSWHFFVSKNCPSWLETTEHSATGYVAQRRMWSPIRRKIVRVGLRLGWVAYTGPRMPFAGYRQFPIFPNPHLRSNGFMVARERLSSYDTARFVDKLNAYAFESGANSLTSQLRRQGLTAVVVGDDGVGYDVPDWPKSGTFRLGTQANLLLVDNQSRAFAEASPESRETIAWMTWGDYLSVPRDDNVNFGFSFPRRSLAQNDIRPPRLIGAVLLDVRIVRRLGRELLLLIGGAHTGFGDVVRAIFNSDRARLPAERDVSSR